MTTSDESADGRAAEWHDTPETGVGAGGRRADGADDRGAYLDALLAFERYHRVEWET